MKVIYNLAVTISLFIFAVRNGVAKRLGQTNAMAQTKQRRELARTKKSVLDQSSEANIQFNKDMGPSPDASFQFNNVITSVEVDNADLYNPNKAYGELDTVKEAAVEASKCLNLEKLEPDYSGIPEKYWCLPDYCEAITSAEECQAAFYKGCSYCSGSCVAAAGIQQAVITCVREAYSNAEPNMVNGKKPDAETIPSDENIIFHNMAGLSELKNVVGADESVMSWGIYQDSRPKDTRVPIHVHPLGGYTCVDKGPVAMEVQGAPTVIFNDGDAMLQHAGIC